VAWAEWAAWEASERLIMLLTHLSWHARPGSRSLAFAYPKHHLPCLNLLYYYKTKSPVTLKLNLKQRRKHLCHIVFCKICSKIHWTFVTLPLHPALLPPFHSGPHDPDNLTGNLAALRLEVVPLSAGDDDLEA